MWLLFKGGYFFLQSSMYGYFSRAATNQGAASIRINTVYVAGAVHGVLIKGDVLISGVSLKRGSKIYYTVVIFVKVLP